MATPSHIGEDRLRLAEAELLTHEINLGATALNPHLGYATAIAKEALATGKGVAELVLEHGRLANLSK